MINGNGIPPSTTPARSSAHTTITDVIAWSASGAVLTVSTRGRDTFLIGA
jgi:hypothetical protein